MVTRSVRLFVVALFALGASAAFAHQTGPTATDTSPSPTALVRDIDSALTDPELRGGIQAVLVESLATGETWYERSPDILMLPASNQKLLTSAAALHLLGPDHRFETRVYSRAGALSKGRVHGDIVLKGGGDPFLDDEGIASLARQMRAKGVRSIDGGVIGDPSVFGEQGYGDGWAWDDMTYYYSVPVSGLNHRSNVMRLRAIPGKAVGARADVVVEPTNLYGTVVSLVRTAAKGVTPRLSVERRLGADHVVVRGHVPMGIPIGTSATVTVSVENPALYAATRLTQALREVGITVARDPRAGAASTRRWKALAEHRGETLTKVLARLNKPSDNLAAECLLRTLATARGKPGTVQNGRDEALAWYQSIGMQRRGIIMMDGSGLSRQNFVSARNLAILLRHMHRHPSAAAFRDSLPVAGVDGTLRNRMKDTPAAANCRAKTGYVSNVSSLSGYVSTAAGEPLMFVMLMNNHPCRNAGATAVQDRIVKALAAYGKPQ
ncbi:MAG: D-alanyl-D-alanine carboxypeptidase/D-alanyl-D-alanine-endopeptidase [Armatimonadetes bacterium]|nr:D-alanyl-D-alanine carboxypeptidase/D-alanyl-D-alanine-endopeptidase [Armatimonadota bacterium]